MNLLRTQDIAAWPDPHTHPWLLPACMRQEENQRAMDCYRVALRIAMDTMLTFEQRDILHLRFWQKLSMPEIGRRLGISSSGASKRLASSLEALRRHIEFCVTVHAALNRQEEE